VRAAAVLAFGVAAGAGLALAALTTAVLIAVGAASIAAGWLYTGGPRPYGYAGYGELFVFVFFGLVAVCGTTYVAGGHLPAAAFAASVPVGLLAVALLVVNNLRDIPTDARSAKITLAVRLGAQRTRVLYAGCLLGALGLGAMLGLWRPWAALTLLAVPLAARPLRLVLAGTEGRELVSVLVATGGLQLAVGVLLSLGIAL
jgi:1,4-dihydroxy-2-naphthoate octaprenyltransferase